MELQTIVKQVKIIQTVFDDFDERPLDCDLVLPEYLPDIASVLKCMIDPKVQNYQISGDRVMADGTVTIRLLYLDEERRCIRTFENAQPFTATFTVKGLGNNCRVKLSTRINYVNCRATGPRRADIHGAFCVCLKVTGEKEESIIEEIDNTAVRTRHCSAEYSRLSAFAEKAFTVSEVVELKNGSCSQIPIRTQAISCITDCKALAGKAVIKGELILKTVYSAEDGSGALCTCENVVPFSQIVDADGLTEEQITCCRSEVLMCEVHPVQNANGDSMLLSLSAKLMVSLQSYEKDDCTMLLDAYHMQYPLKCRMKQVEPWCVTAISDRVLPVNLSVDRPDSAICAVEDLWCDGIATQMSGDELSVHLSVCMITRDDKGCLSYYERPAEFSLQHGEHGCLRDVEIAVMRLSYTLSGDRIDIQLQLSQKGLVSQENTYSIIGELSADETTPYVMSEGMNGCCMKVYYGNQGESLWEIAKAQHLPIEQLCKENQLHGDVLNEDMVLLLPLR